MYCYLRVVKCNLHSAIPLQQKPERFVPVAQWRLDALTTIEVCRHTHDNEVVHAARLRTVGLETSGLRAWPQKTGFDWPSAAKSPTTAKACHDT